MMASVMPQREDVERWSVEQVSAWLQQMQLSECCEVFLRKGIDGYLLMGLTEDAMLLWGRDLCMRSRKQIMKLVLQIKEPQSVNAGKAQMGQIWPPQPQNPNSSGWRDQDLQRHNTVDDDDGHSDNEFEESDDDVLEDNGQSQQKFGHSNVPDDDEDEDELYMTPVSVPTPPPRPGPSPPSRPPKQIPAHASSPQPSQPFGVVLRPVSNAGIRGNNPVTSQLRKPLKPVGPVPTRPTGGGPRMQGPASNVTRGPAPLPNNVPAEPTRNSSHQQVEGRNSSESPFLRNFKQPLQQQQQQQQQNHQPDSSSGVPPWRPMKPAPVPPIASKPNKFPGSPAESRKADWNQRENQNHHAPFSNKSSQEDDPRKNWNASQFNAGRTSISPDTDDHEYETVEVQPPLLTMGSDIPGIGPRSTGPPPALPPRNQDNKDPSNRPGQSQGSQQPPNNFSRPFVNQNRPVQPEKLPVSPGQKPQNVLPPQGRQALISGPPGEEIQNQTGKPLTVPGSLGAGGQNRPILPPPYSVGGSQGLSVPKTPQIPTQPPPPLSNPSRRIPSGPPALPERPPPAPPAAPELPPAENAPAPPSRPKANPVKIGPERVFLGDGEYVDLIPLYRSIYERPYFHMISRKSSKQLLEGANCGTFLIRPSKRSNNPLTLSLRYNQQTYNINIRQRPDNLFALGSEKPNEATFSNIEHIVATYTREPLKLQSGEKTLLLESPRKNDVYVRL